MQSIKNYFSAHDDVLIPFNLLINSSRTTKIKCLQSPVFVTVCKAHSHSRAPSSPVSLKCVDKRLIVFTQLFGHAAHNGPIVTLHSLGSNDWAKCLRKCAVMWKQCDRWQVHWVQSGERIHSFMTKLFCSWCCHFLSKLVSWKQGGKVRQCLV